MTTHPVTVVEVGGDQYAVNKPHAVQSLALAACIVKLVAPVVSEPAVVSAISGIKKDDANVDVKEVTQMIVGFMDKLDVELLVKVVTELASCCIHQSGVLKGQSVDFNTTFADDLDKGVELAYRVAETCFSKYFRQVNTASQGSAQNQ